MEALKQLSVMPGVVGSMVFDAGGQVLGSAFPPLFDATTLSRVAAGLAADGYFVEWTAGEQSAYDLRFAEGWVGLRRVAPSWLLVLCTPQANAQLVHMSLTQVARRLKANPSSQGLPLPAPPPRPTLGDRLRALVQAELGAHAAQALELLAAGGEDPARLASSAVEVERLTRLFIDKRKADELGRKLRDELGR
ncbi:MAG: roadblock/LC7 domain-containing protein [Archangium sp.]|nr:roadblock/LC7 domain-containing protein [Archangium sp.]